MLWLAVKVVVAEGCPEHQSWCVPLRVSLQIRSQLSHQERGGAEVEALLVTQCGGFLNHSSPYYSPFPECDLNPSKAPVHEAVAIGGFQFV